jgi:thioredoxin domain-containing protein 10
LKNIRVVRIDATVYSDITNYYDIRGFPTVKFIRGSQIFTYENERSKSAVINFLKRVNGPSVRWITSIDKFNELRREHEVFFLLLTTTTTMDEDDQLIKEYKNVVNQYLSQAYFYATNQSIIHQTYFSEYQFDDQSQIFAVKNEGFYLYKPNNFNNHSLEEFILKEKITTFPQVAAGNIYDLILTKKIIIIYGFSEQQKTNELKSQINNYVIKHSSTLHDTFQFAWSNDLELLNNIAVWTLEPPLLLLYDHTQRKYGIYQLSSIIDENIQIESILNYIISNYSQIIKYTGNTWRKRLFRPFWEFYRTLIAMFIEAPFLSMLIIGLPASVLSIVCYCICCLPNETAMDDREIPYEKIEDDEEEEEEEKIAIEKKDD